MALVDNSNSDSLACSNGSGTPHGKHDSSSSNDDCGASLELHELMDMLPQELYDQIYDVTFTAVAKVRIYNYDGDYGPIPALLRNATKHYSERVVAVNERPPHLLHVDRASRQKFAKSYYGNPASTFIFSTVALFPVREKPFMSLMQDVRLIAWTHFAAASSRGRRRLADWAGVSTEDIDIIPWIDIPALLKKRIGGVEKAAAGYIDSTIEAVDGSARR